MTNILYSWLKEEYPPLNGHDRLYGYPPPEGLERIALNLISREFFPSKVRMTVEEIKEIASKVFDDISWEYFEKAGVVNNVILFDSQLTYNSGLNKDLDYIRKYDNHAIEIFTPFSHPMLEISLGWRGTSRLHPRQREKYFDFVNKLYGKYILNARK
jgi:hypothetical protein